MHLRLDIWKVCKSVQSLMGIQKASQKKGYCGSAITIENRIISCVLKNKAYLLEPARRNKTKPCFLFFLSPERKMSNECLMSETLGWIHQRELVITKLRES